MISITEKEYQLLTRYIKQNYGINLKEEKKVLLTGRLQNVLISKGFRSFTEYYEYILHDTSGEAIKTLASKITTNHTYFMREVDHFYYFRNEVLPYLLKTVRNRDLRIWSAGCSSGEEPYTLAMLIDELLGPSKPQWETKLLATDISPKVLEMAATGIYSNENIAMIPAAWKLNYFEKQSPEASVIKDRIKHDVIFRKFNLMSEVFPFKRKFHTIFCRNVMIYFDEITKRTLIHKFYDILENGGYLFIGLSESLVRDETKFQCVAPSVYRKV